MGVCTYVMNMYVPAYRCIYNILWQCVISIAAARPPALAARAKLPSPPLPATPNQAHSFRPPEFDSSDCPLALPLRLLPPAAGAAGAPSAIKLSDAAAHPAPSEGGGLPSSSSRSSSSAAVALPQSSEEALPG